MLQTLKDYWAKVKLWFHNSETIFLARLEAVVGLIIAAVSGFDWSPLVALGSDAAFSIKQGVYLGSIMFVKGVITEWARRRNDPYLIVKQAAITQEVKGPEVAEAKKEVLTTAAEVK